MKNLKGSYTCILFLKQQYISSATSLKERFQIHKSNMNNRKIRCGVANKLLNVCKSAICQTKYL